MSRDIFPYEVPDMALLAKTLKRELENRDKSPGHVEFLNILSRAAGFRNFQHLRASKAAEARGKAPVLPQEPVDHARVEAALRCFDGDGVLTRWPARTSIQQLCLWPLWAAFNAEQDMSEKEVNAVLKAHHAFGDHVLLRREMVNQKLLQRTPDCRIYRRVERRPPAEALSVMRGRHR